jgi:hypothetical protein
VILLVATLVATNSKTARLASGMFFLLGGFNLLAYQENLHTIPVVFGSGLGLVVLFAIAYTYFCTSILGTQDFASRWRMLVAAYLPAFYLCLLGAILGWIAQLDMARRGMAAYVTVLFAVAVHMPLFLSERVRHRRSHGNSLKNSIPAWFWFSVLTLAVLAVIAEVRGAKEWGLLGLNLASVCALCLPLLLVRERRLGSR